MTSDESLRSVLGRLERLERAHRRLRVGAVILSAVIVVVLWAVPPQPTAGQGPQTVAVQRLVLVSPGRQTAGAAMQFTRRGPELVLYDPGEIPRIRIGVEETGPSVNLLDGRGGKRASLGFFDGEPAMILYDKGLRVRAVISIVQDRPTITLLDENRRRVFQAP